MEDDMIIEQYYINTAPIKAQTDTGLAADELEAVVGRFPRHHDRRGHLRGEVVIYADGKIRIQHHFTKKVLWESE
jgi:hypothetical protein